MDPMSAITAGLGALTSIFKAAGGIADAVDSFAGLASKVFDTLNGMIKEPQSEQVAYSAEESTSGWPQDQRGYALTSANAVFSTSPTSANASELPLAA